MIFHYSVDYLKITHTFLSRRMSIHGNSFLVSCLRFHSCSAVVGLFLGSEFPLGIPNPTIRFVQLMARLLVLIRGCYCCYCYCCCCYYCSLGTHCVWCGNKAQLIQNMAKLSDENANALINIITDLKKDDMLSLEFDGTGDKWDISSLFTAL